MFDLPLHPALVHIPLGLTVIMPLLILVFAWSIYKAWLPKKSWLILVLLQSLIFASGFLAMETGEHDEERVEKVVSENLIEEHEEKAEAFVWLSGGVTLLLLLALVAPQKFQNPAKAASFVLVLVNLLLAASLGHSGGELVYKHNAASAHFSNSGTEIPNVDSKSHHDD